MDKLKLRLSRMQTGEACIHSVNTAFLSRTALECHSHEITYNHPTVTVTDSLVLAAFEARMGHRGH